MRLINKTTRGLRKNSVFFKLWMVAFCLYISFNVREIFFKIPDQARYFDDSSGDIDVGSHTDGHFYNILNAKSKEELIHQRIARSRAGNFTYVSRGNAPVFDSSRGQFGVVEKYLNKKEHGFFVEIGTEGDNPGSLTFLLELERGWSGLVVEPYKKKFDSLMQMKRNSHFILSCLNITGGNWPSMEPSSEPCLNILDILKVIGRDHIDLLVLDVSGREKHVLTSFPFNDVNVSMISVELHGTNSMAASPIVTQLKPQFKSVQLMTNHIYWRTDLIFLNKRFNL